MTAPVGEDRETVVGVQLCVGCSNALRSAAAGLRKQLLICASCKGAIAARFVDGRWVR